MSSDELTAAELEYNTASTELLQLGAYGHFQHWRDGEQHPRAYLEVLRAAQERFEAAVAAKARTAAFREAAEVADRLRDKTVGITGISAVVDELRRLAAAPTTPTMKES